MSSQAVARFEARTLLRHFLRLRYEFPSKQVRSILRRRIVSFFQIHQVEYEHMISKNGLDAANHRASVWRKEAAQDLGTLYNYFLIYPIRTSWSGLTSFYRSLAQTREVGREHKKTSNQRNTGEYPALKQKSSKFTFVYFLLYFLLPTAFSPILGITISSHPHTHQRTQHRPLKSI